MNSQALDFITLPKGAVKAVIKDRWSASFIVIVDNKSIKSTVYHDRPHKLFITYPSVLSEINTESNIEIERSFYLAMGDIGRNIERIHELLLSLFEREEEVEKVFIQQ